MTETLNKYLQIGLFVVLAVSLVLFVVFYINGESMTDTVLTLAYILLVITVALLLTFPVISFIKNPKRGLMFLAVVAGFGILYGISWTMASGDAAADIYLKSGVGSEVSRMIGAGLIMTYILVGLTILSMVYASISRAFK